jgi:phosphatidylinositol-3-phosphatase
MIFGGIEMASFSRFRWHIRILTILMFFLALILSSAVVLRSEMHTFASLSSPIKTVFVIVMENKNWSSIRGNASAPYINNTLLPMASYADQYYTPPHNHPSLPNYLWLEAGTNFGILNDDPPSTNHQSTTRHLVTLLQNAGYSWKSYVEGISGTTCPLQNTGLYAVRHNGSVYFDDVTGTNNPQSSYCIAHERPYAELATDLQANGVANYNYIVPNVCDDMHNSTGCQTTNEIKNGDSWLALNVPKILNSQAYRSGGLLLITWDEGTNDSDGPVGLIALSPYAKGHGYSNAMHYTHSSTLLTIEEVFGLTSATVAPLGAAAMATDLSDLFIATALPSPFPSPTITSTPTPTAPVTLSVSITAPATNSIVPRHSTVPILVAVSDTVRISKVELFVNGKLLCTDTTAPYSCTWQVPGKQHVPYLLQAKTADAEGNTASSTISVRSS